MSPSLHPMVGIIRLESVPPEHLSRRVGDDSSLEQLLASLACRLEHHASGHQTGEPIRLVAARRLNWAPAGASAMIVRANLVQLIDDLEAEFEQLEGMAT